MSSAIDTATLPVFLRAFSAYHFRVRFEARQAITFSDKWYFLPRYALGNALKNSSRFSHLYDELFKPQEPEGPGSSPSSRLVIRADKPSRRGFGAGEALDLYITIISGSPRLVEDFLTFLPEWQAYNFFHDYRFIYRSYQLLNPDTALFEAGLPIDRAQLTIDFFVCHAPSWRDRLRLCFLTPTTLKVDQLLTPDIPYTRLMNRLSRRLYLLYAECLSDGSSPPEPFVFAEQGEVRYKQISMPKSATIKTRRHYDMAGFLGEVVYQIPYDPTAAVMLSIAHWVHIGSHTVSGNGQVRASDGAEIPRPASPPPPSPVESKTPEALPSPKPRREKFHRREAPFDLVVAEPGASVGISRNDVVIRKGGQVLGKHPAEAIEHISIISEGVSLSSNVTKYCRKRSIRVVFYDAEGKPYATLEGPETILPSVMEAQMSLSDRKARHFIQALVTNKVKNQSKLLRYYLKYHHKSETLRATLTEAIDALGTCATMTIDGESLDDFRRSAMLLEARAARIYWQAYAALVANAGYAFERREQRGAADVVNQMLNYGYAILLSHVARSIDLWQLNPQVGILHSTQDRRPSLCFDLMEQYRAFVVDRSVLALLSKGEVCRQDHTGLLDMSTRTRLISKLNERHSAVEYYRSGEKVFADIMKLQTREVRDYCMGETDKIKFYTPKW